MPSLQASAPAQKTRHRRSSARFFSERTEAPGDAQLARGIDYACGTYGIDADLPDESYEPIGRAIAGLLADYHAQWCAHVLPDPVGHDDVER
ncbi:MAG: hypothetical protein WC830_00605 [Burkholderiales bacterium]